MGCIFVTAIVDSALEVNVNVMRCVKIISSHFTYLLTVRLLKKPMVVDCF